MRCPSSEADHMGERQDSEEKYDLKRTLRQRDQKRPLLVVHDHYVQRIPSTPNKYEGISKSFRTGRLEGEL
jgi:alpha-L-fucosidase